MLITLFDIIDDDELDTTTGDDTAEIAFNAAETILELYPPGEDSNEEASSSVPEITFRGDSESSSESSDGITGAVVGGGSSKGLVGVLIVVVIVGIGTAGYLLLRRKSKQPWEVGSNNPFNKR